MDAQVADCIALFSLDKFDLVPVDTHVWQISQRYMPSLKGKSLNPRLHAEIAAFWREKFGRFAGWAHTVLFAAELAAFKGLAEEEEAGRESKGSVIYLSFFFPSEKSLFLTVTEDSNARLPRRSRSANNS
jgi:hypothetical protein